ncbi:glycosyltransferase [Chloroflexota bacterium]
MLLAKNNERTIQECLEAVRQNNPEEILVLDGLSTDKTIEIARRYTGKIYSDGGNGVTYARQLGAELANEDYIAYVDADVILAPNTLQVMLNELQMKGWAAIHARLLAIPMPGYFNWADHQWKNVIRPERPGERKFIAMHANLFPRDIILKYGIDPSLRCDDVDLSYRLLKNGHKIGISSAHCYHYQSATIIKHFYWNGTGTAKFLLKYKNSPTAVIRYVIIGALAFPVYGMLLSVVKGDLRLIPFFVVDACVQTAGLIKELLDALIRFLKQFGIVKIKE